MKSLLILTLSLLPLLSTQAKEFFPQETTFVGKKKFDDITKKFPTTMPNKYDEMSKLWKYYRYLKHNPKLRTQMTIQEKRMTAMTVKMVEKSKVAGIEKDLRNGETIGIARHGNGSYCSHVGIIKDEEGRTRFLLPTKGDVPPHPKRSSCKLFKK